MTQLSVNLNKIALVRNSRGGDRPSVLRAARTAVDAGAHGITVHPRPDERHIRETDCTALAEALDVEFNIEGYPNDRYMRIVEKCRPAQATLVPDRPGQLTSDHGWDVAEDAELLADRIGELKAAGVRVSVFMDPVPGRMATVAELGADRVELYTEAYAKAFGTADEDRVFEGYAEAAKAARDAGLGVNAGHDLDLDNLAKFVTIEGVLEVSIGHALISDALYMGLVDAVKAYLEQVG